MYHSEFDSSFERPRERMRERKREVGKRQTDKHHTNDMIVVYVILS